jgi:hypothetical protein
MSIFGKREVIAGIVLTLVRGTGTGHPSTAQLRSQFSYAVLTRNQRHCSHAQE